MVRSALMVRSPVRSVVLRGSGSVGGDGSVGPAVAPGTDGVVDVADEARPVEDRETGGLGDAARVGRQVTALEEDGAEIRVGLRGLDSGLDDLLAEALLVEDAELLDDHLVEVRLVVQSL